VEFTSRQSWGLYQSMCVSMHTFVNVWTLEQACAVPGGAGGGRGRGGGGGGKEQEEEEWRGNSI
jgi:hypothetical protein